MIRADELVGRTLDRVEQTTETAHKTVISPVQQVSGDSSGSDGSGGVPDSGRRRNRDGIPAAQDEMFI